MSWIDSVFPPKLSSVWRKRDIPENRWIKCPESGQLVFFKDLEENQFVIPGSDYHMRMAAGARLKALFDDGAFETIATPDVPTDPLKFRDQKRYIDRLKAAREETGLDDAILVGAGTLDRQPVVAAVQDFKFMGGSLGMAAGEAVVTGMMEAITRKTAFVLFAASGGARMQEGMFSLMQMPRTTVAVQRLRRARLPYIVVLTHPTTGGVTASYAMLGDVHLAEPGALIGFAGPRVIEQTIREKLPEGFQRSEYLLEHGMIDQVVHRHDLRDTLSRLVRVLTKAPVADAVAVPTHDAETLETHGPHDAVAPGDDNMASAQRMLDATGPSDAAGTPSTGDHGVNGAAQTDAGMADDDTTAATSKAGRSHTKNGTGKPAETNSAGLTGPKHSGTANNGAADDAEQGKTGEASDAPQAVTPTSADKTKAKATGPAKSR